MAKIFKMVMLQFYILNIEINKMQIKISDAINSKVELCMYIHVPNMY